MSGHSGGPPGGPQETRRHEVRKVTDGCRITVDSSVIEALFKK